MTTDLTTQTPRQIDERLAELQIAIYNAADRLEIAETDLRYAAGQRKMNRRWTGTIDDAIARCTEIAESDEPGYKPRDARRALERHQERADALAAAQQATLPYDTEYLRRPWSRFFLVTSSSGGHIHSSTACSTTRITTRFGWLPSVSGKTEVEAVAEHGPLLCTVCFPSAPVEWTIGRQDHCPGSNQHVPQDKINRRYRTAYAPCPECGETQQYTMSGIRKHKPKAA